MNRSYNHIKHLVGTNDYVKSIRRPLHWQVGKGDANQLDDEQRQPGFYYYEYDMLKFGTPTWGTWAQTWSRSSLDRISFKALDFQEHLEDLEQDQARRQGIHGHGRGESC